MRIICVDKCTFDIDILVISNCFAISYEPNTSPKKKNIIFHLSISYQLKVPNAYII